MDDDVHVLVALRHLLDHRARADYIEIRLRRVFDRGIALCDDDDFLVFGGARGLDRGHADRAPDRERHQHRREEHGVLDRQERQGHQRRFFLDRGCRGHRSPPTAVPGRVGGRRVRRMYGRVRGGAIPPR